MKTDKFTAIFMVFLMLIIPFSLADTTVDEGNGNSEGNDLDGTGGGDDDGNLGDELGAGPVSGPGATDAAAEAKVANQADIDKAKEAVAETEERINGLLEKEAISEAQAAESKRQTKQVGNIIGSLESVLNLDPIQIREFIQTGTIQAREFIDAINKGLDVIDEVANMLNHEDTPGVIESLLNARSSELIEKRASIADLGGPTTRNRLDTIKENVEINEKMGFMDPQRQTTNEVLAWGTERLKEFNDAMESLENNWFGVGSRYEGSSVKSLTKSLESMHLRSLRDFAGEKDNTLDTLTRDKDNTLDTLIKLAYLLDEQATIIGAGAFLASLLFTPIAMMTGMYQFSVFVGDLDEKNVITSAYDNFIPEFIRIVFDNRIGIEGIDSGNSIVNPNIINPNIGNFGRDNWD